MRLRSNRSREIVCLTVFLTVVGLQPGTGYSQVDRHEIEPALSGTEKELRPQFGAVRFHRLERLEDKFLILGTASVAQLAPHFFDEGHKNGFDLTKKWWKSFTGKSGAIEIQTKKTTDGFAVNLPVFWAPVESQVVPEIRVYRIDVSSGGYCHLNEPI